MGGGGCDLVGLWVIWWPRVASEEQKRFSRKCVDGVRGCSTVLFSEATTAERNNQTKDQKMITKKTSKSKAEQILSVAKELGYSIAHRSEKEGEQYVCDLRWFDNGVLHSQHLIVSMFRTFRLRGCVALPAVSMVSCKNYVNHHMAEEFSSDQVLAAMKEWAEKAKGHQVVA